MECDWLRCEYNGRLVSSDTLFAPVNQHRCGEPVLPAGVTAARAPSPPSSPSQGESDETSARARRAGEAFVELLLVADERVLQAHGSDTTRYLLTALNVVAQIYAVGAPCRGLALKTQAFSGVWTHGYASVC